jgi:N-acetylglutamate synthase-like GNAT family acetyltransferase
MISALRPALLDLVNGDAAKSAMLPRTEFALSEYMRNVGIGRFIVDALVYEAKLYGLDAVFAFTYVEGFFARAGFHVVERGELPLKAWKELATIRRCSASKTATWSCCPSCGTSWTRDDSRVFPHPEPTARER